MIRRPPRSTRTDTLFPYTTLFRSAAASARLLIVGQAPGTRVHETGIPWNDRSGDRLRDWLQLPPELFYDERRIAIVPMGFCYPAVAANGCEKPPRPECAPRWPAPLRDALTKVEFTLLVGLYADRKSVGLGTSVLVRVDIGGSRNLNRK